MPEVEYSCQHGYGDSSIGAPFSGYSEVAGSLVAAST